MIDITFFDRTDDHGDKLRVREFTLSAESVLVFTKESPRSTATGVRINFQQAMKLRDRINDFLAANVNKGPRLWEDHEL